MIALNIIDRTPQLNPSLLNIRVAAFWDITFSCNLRCKHCAVVPSRQGPHSLSDGDTMRMLENLLAGPEIITELNIQGGEPTIAPNLLTAVRWLGEHRVPWSMISNGLGWRDDHYRIMRRFPPIGLCFSLDGSNAASHDWVRGHGSFDCLVRTIAQCRELFAQMQTKIPLSVICVLNKRNVSDFQAIIEMAADMGISSLMFNHLIVAGAAIPNRESLVPSPEDLIDVTSFVCKHGGSYRGVEIHVRWLTPLMAEYYTDRFGTNTPITISICGAIRSSLFITPNGHLLPCPNMHRLGDNIGNEDFPLASEETNLVTRTLSAIRRSNYFARSYEGLHGISAPIRPSRCLNCRYSQICVPCPSQHYSGESHTEDLCFAFQDHLNYSGAAPRESGSPAVSSCT